MHKKIKLILCTLGANNPAVIERLNASDLILARGAQSTAWLERNKVTHVTPFLSQKKIDIDTWIVESTNGLPDNAVITYVTTISPVLTDCIASKLSKLADLKNVEIIDTPLLTSALLSQLEYNSDQPTLFLDGLNLIGRHHPPFSADQNVFIFEPGSIESITALKHLLQLIFPLDHTIYLSDSKDEVNLSWSKLALSQFDEITTIPSIVFIPAFTSDSSLEQFQEIIAHLRAPEDGCPWDKKQTHTSLRTYLLEETYEALDALDKNDLVSLKEELGDILLQILLHAQIASEAGEFTMADVLSGINRKIVYRHPHVFKDWVVEGEKDVVQNWEQLKGKERLKNGDEARKGMLDGVPISYPALAQAQAIQDRAARVGFDWPDIEPVFDKVMEELEEVKTAANDEERAKELGDLLFALVNVIRWYKVDSESVLRQTNLKFRKRFAYIEEQARLTGKDMQKMSLAEMDNFWEQAKAFDV